MARHTASLSYRELMEAVQRLLTDDGEFSLVIPFDCLSQLESEAALAGFFLSRRCAVKTTPRKPPRRYLLAFRKHPCQPELTEGIIETSPGIRSPWYQQLTREFYL
jgi:tRNA1Val (adenine37-N6)-methyltransferase